MKMPMEMTLDEAILHCEEVASRCDSRKCADDHRQLAEWLKELKERRASELSSAQPVDKDIDVPSTDTISRQAAIDAADELLQIATHEEKHKLSMLRRVLKDVLPSAQTEIIRCRDCRHFEYDHPYIIQGVPVLGHEVCNAWGDGCKTDENGYCFLAERRTDA